MELASLALIAVVFVLQIIALTKIAGLEKSLTELKQIKPAPVPAASAPSNERFDRNRGDSRRPEKRPQQGERPRHQQQPQAPQASQAAPAAPVAPAPVIDAVETSLRDINLRLKNAERDQDFARKKIQENLGDRDQHHRGHDRSDRGNDRYNREGGDRNREGSSDRGDRDRNRGGRGDRGRNQRRDNGPSQGNRYAPRESAAPASAQIPAGESPTFEQKSFSAPAPVEQYIPAVSVASAVEATASPASPVFDPTPVVSSFDGNEESMEHGRKVMVKRRPLRDESSDGANGQTEAKETSVSEASPSEEKAEIQFGRRKAL